MNRMFFPLGVLALLPAIAFADVTPLVPSTTAARHHRLKQILGTTVAIEGNTSVGIVDDIVVDDNGNVDYLIVINADKKLVTVPWSATKFDSVKRSALIQIDADRYRRIPSYTVEQYPEFSAPEYRSQIDQYYGLTPDRRRVIKRGNPGVVK